MDIKEIVSKFEERTNVNGKLMVRCPAHDDHTPSLCIEPGNKGGVVFHCFAGCQIEDILTAVDLTFKDISPEQDDDTGSGSIPFAELVDHKRPIPKQSNGLKEIARYNYYDEFAALVCQVRRYEPKTFRQFRPHLTKADKWIPNVKGIRRVPYNLPKIMNAKVGEWVVIVEGEKSADAVEERLGMISTTFLGGAGKFEEHYTDFFDKRRVAIVPDNDTPGQEHAELIAEKLFKTAREIRIVDLSDELKPKQDIVDWLDAGNDQQLFERRILEAPLYNGLGLPFMTAEQLAGADMKIEWLIKDLIPVETGGALVGPSAAGKTWILLDLALAMASGGKWLGRFDVKQGTVAIIDEENAAPLIKERLIKLARARKIDLLTADLPIYILAGHEIDFTPTTVKGELTFTKDHYKLIDSLKTMNADLVIFDSLTRVHRVDENSASEMSDVFASLKSIMRGARTGVMFTHHYNKGEQRSTSNRIRGSSDIRAWCDYALAIESMDRDDDGTLTIKVEHDKSRYGEPVKRFKVALTSTWHNDIQGLSFLYRGEIEPGRPKKTADVWSWIKDKLSDGASMYNSAILTACANEKPGFGLTKLKSELAKRHRNGQLEKGEDGIKVIWSIAISPNDDLNDFGDAVRDSKK